MALTFEELGNLQARLVKVERQNAAFRLAAETVLAEGVECLGPERCDKGDPDPCGVCRLNAALDSPDAGRDFVRRAVLEQCRARLAEAEEVIDWGNVIDDLGGTPLRDAIQAALAAADEVLGK